ncbi:MAG: SDR family NAD(P)-dependent oxidoreductase [Micropruina sp.]|uniref:SDR family NAD(P)-dependent oxidoreductase n=1 Tax=Micropruina sp. TaxID=2737536 RepID=UPI0039E60F78
MSWVIGDRLPGLRLPDLVGRWAVVTGASGGIGFATAAALVGAGAQVVLAVRSRQRGEEAAARIRRLHACAEVSVECVELSSLASIAETAQRIGGRPVHLLVNNAGLGGGDPQAVTEDGFDLQVGVNYLGAWALTAQLWPALCQAGQARVVTLGSTMAARGRIGPDFGYPTGSDYRSYCDSKLATIVFANELRRRAEQAPVDVTAVPAHPGWCATAIFGNGGPPALVTFLGKLAGAIQSPADGAQPVLMAATDPHPGAYYGPTKHRGSAGPPGAVPLPAPALDEGIGTRLWERSTDLTGLSFPL